MVHHYNDRLPEIRLSDPGSGTETNYIAWAQRSGFYLTTETDSSL